MLDMSEVPFNVVLIVELDLRKNFIEKHFVNVNSSAVFPDYDHLCISGTNKSV